MPKYLVRATLSKTSTALSSEAVRRRVRKTLSTTGTQARNLLKKPTRNWKHPPRFEKRFEEHWASMAVIVKPTGPQKKKYTWLDFGVKKHIILPKNVSRLRFKSGYRSSTLPNKLWSRRAGRSGKTVFAKRVSHPGIAPRNFSEQVFERMQPVFRKKVDDLLRELTRNA